jgi:hypothetical protein
MAKFFVFDSHVDRRNVSRENWPHPVVHIVKECVVGVFTQSVKILGRQFGAELHQ